MNGLFTNILKRINLKKQSDKLTLWFFGDIHADSDGFDEDAFKEFIYQFEHSENPYAIGMGDYLDLAATSDQKKIIGSHLHESAIKSLDSLSKSEITKLFNRMKPLKGRTIGLIGGNHQWRYASGKLSDEDLAERLGAEYLGWLSVIGLSICVCNKIVSLDIFACHGKAGGKLLGTSINQIKDLQAIIGNADVYAMGHDHKRSATCDPVLMIDRKSADGLRSVRPYFVRSGSFLRHYVAGTESYVHNRLHKPADIGAISLDISMSRKKHDYKEICSLNIKANV